MKRALITAALLVATTSVAVGGGIDRSRTDTLLLFEDGDRGKLSFGYVDPSVSGTYSAAFGPAAGTSTANMAKPFTTLGFGYKRDLNDRWSVALLVDQPYSADASYVQGPYTGLDATWNSESISLLGLYRFNDNFSVFGGPRAVRSRPKIVVPALLGQAASVPRDPAGNPIGPPVIGTDYTARGSNETDYGIVVGAAYERHDIALRVALSYQSEISHSFASVEGFNGAFLTDRTVIKLPQVVTLDFQSGIAPETLVFGSVRWSEWSVFDVRTPGYEAATGDSVTSIDEDVWTLTLGVGRRLNENLSVFARVGYEETTGTIVSRLAPTDGRKSVGVGGTYTQGNASLTGGVEYIELGNATDSAGTTFTGNSAIAAGLSVTFGF